MLQSFRKSGSNPLIWGILGLLAVGLIGFGGNVSRGLSASGLASVGSQSVTTDDFIRGLRQEISSLSEQFGQSLTLDQARQLGVEGTVLAKLLTAATLDGQAAEFGISAGDTAVRDQLLVTPAFQGPDGNFDKGAYDFALERLNFSPADYEETVRRGLARSLLRDGVAAGAVMPGKAAQALLAFAGEKRSFDRVTIDAAALPDPLPDPAEADLAAYYDGHPDDFMLPESRAVTALVLTPEDLVPGVEVSDAEIAAAYQARIDDFVIPETRAVERLAFASDEEAASARARLDAGEVSFEALVTERGLDLAALDLGMIRAEELEEGARNLVFGPTEPGVYGPAPSLLGPALFRVNAVIAASETSEAEAAAVIRGEIARDHALELVGAEIDRLDDFLAGGTSLEDIAAAGPFRLEEVSWSENAAEGLAADPAFAAEAAAMAEGETTPRIDLIGGGIAALRLDRITPPARQGLDAVREQVLALVRTEQEGAATLKRAEMLKTELDAGKSLGEVAAAHGLRLIQAPAVLRQDQPEGLPPELVPTLFTLEQDGSAAVPAPGKTELIRLRGILPFDPAEPANAAETENLTARLSQLLGDDLFAVFVAEAQSQAGVTINSQALQTLVESLQ